MRNKNPGPIWIPDSRVVYWSENLKKCIFTKMLKCHKKTVVVFLYNSPRRIEWHKNYKHWKLSWVIKKKCVLGVQKLSDSYSKIYLDTFFAITFDRNNHTPRSWCHFKATNVSFKKTPRSRCIDVPNKSYGEKYPTIGGRIISRAARGARSRPYHF